MSSSLYLFDLTRHPMPAPASFEDLESIRKTLHTRPDGKNLRFIEFALRFEEKFPPRPAGSRSPLDRAQAVRTAAWQFDLPPVDTMPAYRAAVEIAASLGLVAYDAELGIGFLPDGRVIPEELAQADDGASSLDEVLCGESEVRAVLAPALAGAMASHGFVLEPEQESHLPFIELTRTIGPVRQRIYVTLWRYEQFVLQLQVQHEACAAVYRAVEDPEREPSPAFDLNFNFFAPGPDSRHRWSLERRSDLGPVLEMVRDKLLPLAELCRDLGGLDQMMNAPGADTIRTPYRSAYSWSDRPHGSDGSRSLLEEIRTRTQRLAIAHLNGNPSASRITGWFDEYFTADRPAREREEYLKLREVLASTAPLVTWSDEHAHSASMRPVPPSLQKRSIDPRGQRCHHWEVGTPLFHAMSNQPAEFWQRFAGPNGQAELQRLWREKADTLPVSERIAPDGLACRVETIARPAQGDEIQVLLLEFPPISGLDEVSILALPRVGETYRPYRMGHDQTLTDEGAIRTYIGYRAKTYTTQETLPHLLSTEKFLDFVRDKFE